MQNSGDDSNLHRLARLFGHGLAFGVGMTLTQQALRPKAAAGARPEQPVTVPEPATVVAPPPQPQQVEPPRPAAVPRSPMDLKAVQAIVGVVEQRIEERAGQTERRLAELEAGVNAKVQALISRQAEGEAALRGQVVKTQREFAEAVARIVAEQVAREVAERTAAIEARVEQRIEAAVAPLRAELRELRQRLAQTESTMHEFANAISDTVRMANERGLFTPAPAREAEPRVVAAETPRRTAPAASPRPAPVRSARTPQHLDLRVLRQRLQAAGRRDDLPRTAFPPAGEPVQRKTAVLRPFAVAS